MAQKNSNMIDQIVSLAQNTELNERVAAAVVACREYRKRGETRSKNREAKGFVKAAVVASLTGRERPAFSAAARQSSTDKGLDLLKNDSLPIATLIGCLDSPSEVAAYYALDAIRASMAHDAWACSTTAATHAEKVEIKSAILAALNKANAGSVNFQPPTDEGAEYTPTVYSSVKSPKAAFLADTAALAVLALILEPDWAETPALCRFYAQGGVAVLCNTWEDVESFKGRNKQLRDEQALENPDWWKHTEMDRDFDEGYED
mgnify:CR=1 FL=1